MCKFSTVMEIQFLVQEKFLISLLIRLTLFLPEQIPVLTRQFEVVQVLNFGNSSATVGAAIGTMNGCQQ